MEPKIAVQIAKVLQGHEGPLTFNLNMNAVMNSLEGQELYIPKPEEIDLLALIESFPQPRMRNFINHIYYLATKKFNGKKIPASEWLGVSYRTLWRSDVKEEPLQLESGK